MSSKYLLGSSFIEIHPPDSLHGVDNARHIRIIGDFVEFIGLDSIDRRNRSIQNPRCRAVYCSAPAIIPGDAPI